MMEGADELGLVPTLDGTKVVYRFSPDSVSSPGVNARSAGHTYDPLVHKYLVRRVDERDGPSDKHYQCDYFVFDLTHDPLAEEMIKEYFKRKV